MSCRYVEPRSGDGLLDLWCSRSPLDGVLDPVSGKVGKYLEFFPVGV